ncbi:uncharacterized protein MYCGRDRAFT_97937 [Zymoseptoria tritici IPO323]|uniref:Uncharacterized protein n=1 Tax=Zymoseptoria tritici (strain CBS 115943 / IPO323) TaxID=336722 RepID=F9XRU4_ZYMTI|nr:uncharacterized protein MYCGRDRAFT_97937 [Zymoseptoria tritici IPO323]EGP82036.1 hypothetical protein MYCGRDRAFT_97937 [Zymoseptoria tritici IPO323]
MVDFVDGDDDEDEVVVVCEFMLRRSSEEVKTIGAASLRAKTSASNHVPRSIMPPHLLVTDYDDARTLEPPAHGDKSFPEHAPRVLIASALSTASSASHRLAATLGQAPADDVPTSSHDRCPVTIAATNACGGGQCRLDVRHPKTSIPDSTLDEARPTTHPAPCKVSICPSTNTWHDLIGPASRDHPSFSTTDSQI